MIGIVGLAAKQFVVGRSSTPKSTFALQIVPFISIRFFSTTEDKNLPKHSQNQSSSHSRMGVPAFFAWLATKHPQILRDLVTSGHIEGGEGKGEGDDCKSQEESHCDNLCPFMDGMLILPPPPVHCRDIVPA